MPPGLTNTTHILWRWNQQVGLLGRGHNYSPLYSMNFEDACENRKGQRIGPRGWCEFCCLSSLPTPLSFTSSISLGKTESGFHQPGENYEEEELFTSFWFRVKFNRCQGGSDRRKKTWRPFYQGFFILGPNYHGSILGFDISMHREKEKFTQQ